MAGGCGVTRGGGRVAGRESYTRSLSETVSIRPARPEDDAEITRLVGLYPDKLLQEDRPELERFFIAELDGRAVGCCALDVYSRRLAEIRSLAVEPEMGRLGVGRRLVKACRDRARELGVRQLLAVSSAVEFFEKSGFSTFRQEKTALFLNLEDGIE